MKSPDSFTLTPELLEDYIYGMLPQAELEALEARIETDPALKAQVDAALKRAYEEAGGSEARLTEARAAFETRTGQSLSAAVQPFYRRPVYQVAAAVLVLLTTVWFWWRNRPAPYAELAFAQAEKQALFDTGKNAIDPASAFERGKLAFTNKQYAKAIKAFEQVAPEETFAPIAQYHLGLAHFLAQDFSAALRAWQKMNPDALDPMFFPGYAETLAWNQALALLATGQQAEATQALEAIKNASGTFSSQAAEVLSEMPAP